MVRDSSMLDGTIASLDTAVRSLGLEDDMRETLVTPWRELQVGMPVQADFLEEESVRVGLRGKPTGRQTTLIFRPKS